MDDSLLVALTIQFGNALEEGNTEPPTKGCSVAFLVKDDLPIIRVGMYDPESNPKIVLNKKNDFYFMDEIDRWVEITLEDMYAYIRENEKEALNNG